MSKMPSLVPREHPGRNGDVASQIARAFVGVRELLMRGEFGRGERISELPMVARLGMSRTPIRLALERLAHIGFLDVVPTGGFAVRGFTITEVFDAIEVRAVLEGTAARLAAERLADVSELNRLREYGALMGALKGLTIDSLSEYMDLNEAFHSALVDLAKSGMLRRSIEQVNSLPFASPSAMVFPTSVLPNADETLAIANLQHRSIIEAIGHRQGTRAESLAREHTFVARRVLEQALSDTNALSRVPGGALINISTA
jgi:GntR family transcriptional regulator, vanillate catabolism transcriptional regulator